MGNKKIKILIVDDEEYIRSLYTEVFTKEGFQVEEANDGLEGLEKATKNVPDILFTGIIMPRMDGFTLIDSLKKNVATADIPIFMSSHMGRKEDEEKAKSVGVKDFFIVGMSSPKQVVERVMSIFKKGAYLLKFDPKELDAPRIAADLKLASNNYFCPKCGADLLLSVEILDLEKRDLKAKFVCPVCG
jgi:CheY-like chemotaxis protein